MADGTQAEEAAYWRALVDNSPDIVLVVDMEGTICFINRVRAPFEGKAAVGTPVWHFTKDAGEERIRGLLRGIAETRRAVRYEAPGFGPGGTTAWYDVSIVPLVFETVVERVLWTATDVTARKRLEEQLRQSQKMEAVGLLAGGVAHDFNNLLGVIVGHAELAALALPEGHPAAADLAEVSAAAQRGAALTRRLLAFSRKQIFQPRLIDLRVAVNDFAKMFSRVVGADVEVVVETSADPEGTVVRADAVQIEQVLLNLCTNARQAMPHGGRLQIETRPVTLDEADVERHPGSVAGPFVELVVRDTGVGMDEAAQARAFEPFFTTRQEGTGLGLATVLGIVQQHGGQVRFESVKGQGTTFRVYLPRAPRESLPVPPAPGESAPVRARANEVVLIAEDDASLRALMTTTLTDLGYRVLPTSDGEEAVRELEAHRSEVSLVVLDVVMPRLGARDARTRMVAVRPDVKILLTSGYAPDSERLGELVAGATIPLLEKPFTPRRWRPP